MEMSCNCLNVLSVKGLLSRQWCFGHVFWREWFVLWFNELVVWVSKPELQHAVPGLIPSAYASGSLVSD